MKDRITALRKAKGWSQEYLAEQMNVSRQAVSKWETGQSVPDMKHLLRLAELFGVKPEALTAGSETPAPCPAPKAKKKRRWPVFAAALAAALLVFGVWRIHTLPVNWDAGACGGGFATAVFDRYADELTQKYLAGSDRAEEILSIEPLRGTHSADWEGRNIYLQFDIRYEHKKEGTVTERVSFTGRRYWVERYRWGGAVIQG